MLRELIEKFKARGASTKGVEFAASVINSPDLPKPRPASAVPSYLRGADQNPDAFLPQNDLRLANIDLESLRFGTSTPAILRQLRRASPDLSAAASAYGRVGITHKYKVIGRNLDGTLNTSATRIAQELCRRFDLLGPTTGGYNSYPSIREASEQMMLELYLLGACSLEVILNRARLPEALIPVAVDTIQFKYQKKKKVPYQILGGKETSLDFPTFFYVSLDQNLRSAYSESPIESSIQPIIAANAFANDLRRVFRRAIVPRLRASLNHEKWLSSVPAEIKYDTEKLEAYQERAIQNIQTLVNGLNPEDAIIIWNILEIDLMNNGATSLPDELQIFASIINGKLAAGAKAMPAVLGHDMASQNVASTQSMLFLLSVSSYVEKLNEIYSRALSLCVRLYGEDAVVEFEYEPPALRPKAELAAFEIMKTDRILNLLSIGMLTDEEANLEVTGSLPPIGAPKLSGTFFKVMPPEIINNPESNTGALERDLSGDSPREPKS